MIDVCYDAEISKSFDWYGLDASLDVRNDFRRLSSKSYGGREGADAAGLGEELGRILGSNGAR